MEGPCHRAYWMGSKDRRTDATFLHSNLSCALLDSFAICSRCFLLLLFLNKRPPNFNDC